LTQKCEKVKLRSSPSVISGSIHIPASKSHTIRAVAFASVAEGVSTLRNPLMSDDAKSAIEGAIEMGASVQLSDDWIIRGIGGIPGETCRNINVGNSGTSLRIFTALCALGSP
jgi:3-phosphoshikimate 1-carboxyvinyltransferase